MSFIPDNWSFSFQSIDRRDLGTLVIKALTQRGCPANEAREAWPVVVKDLMSEQSGIYRQGLSQELQGIHDAGLKV